jgi:hypothetical protein
MAYSALVGDYFDYQRNFVPFSSKSRIKKWYFISPDANGNGVCASYFGDGGSGGVNGGLLQIAPGNFISDDFEVQRYLDMAGLPTVKFLGELPL